MEFWEIVAGLTIIILFLMPTVLVAWEVGWGQRKRHSRRFRFTLGTAFFWITVTCLGLSVWRSGILLAVTGLMMIAFAVALLARFVFEDIFSKQKSARQYLDNKKSGGQEVDVRQWISLLPKEGAEKRNAHTKVQCNTSKPKALKWWLKKSARMRLGRYGLWN